MLDKIKDFFTILKHVIITNTLIKNIGKHPDNRNMRALLIYTYNNKLEVEIEREQVIKFLENNIPYESCIETKHFSTSINLRYTGNRTMKNIRFVLLDRGEIFTLKLWGKWDAKLST